MKIIYAYGYDNGGFADMIKFFMVAVHLSKIHNLQLYIKISHPIANFLVVKEKYLCDFDCSEIEFLSSEKNLKYMLENKMDFMYNTLSYINKYVENNEIPNTNYLFKIYNFYDYIDYTPSIYEKVNKIICEKNYIVSVHLRCGDKYIADSKDFLSDDRLTNVKYEEIIANIMSKNKNNFVYFFCDNLELKKCVKNKFNNINLLYESKILHLSYDNTDKYTLEEITDIFEQTICEFLFMSLSNEIQSLSHSGYPLLAHFVSNKKNKFVKRYRI